MIPLTLTQNYSVQTNLNMEQAISIRGKYLTLKTESGGQGEIVSYEYEPSGGNGYVWDSRPSSMVVRVVYQPEMSGIRVKVSVTPFFGFSIFLLIYGTMSLISVLIPSPEAKFVLGVIPFNMIFGLTFLFFYIMFWWRSRMTMKQTQNLFKEFQV